MKQTVAKLPNLQQPPKKVSFVSPEGFGLNNGLVPPSTHTSPPPVPVAKGVRKDNLVLLNDPISPMRLFRWEVPVACLASATSDRPFASSVFEVSGLQCQLALTVGPSDLTTQRSGSSTLAADARYVEMLVLWGSSLPPNAGFSLRAYALSQNGKLSCRIAAEGQNFPTYGDLLKTFSWNVVCRGAKDPMLVFEVVLRVYNDDAEDGTESVESFIEEDRIVPTNPIDRADPPSLDKLAEQLNAECVAATSFLNTMDMVDPSRGQMVQLIGRITAQFTELQELVGGLPFSLKQVLSVGATVFGDIQRLLATPTFEVTFKEFIDAKATAEAALLTISQGGLPPPGLARNQHFKQRLACMVDMLVQLHRFYQQLATLSTNNTPPSGNPQQPSAGSFSSSSSCSSLSPPKLGSVDPIVLPLSRLWEAAQGLQNACKDLEQYLKIAKGARLCSEQLTLKQSFAKVWSQFESAAQEFQSLKRKQRSKYESELKELQAKMDKALGLDNEAMELEKLIADESKKVEVVEKEITDCQDQMTLAAGLANTVLGLPNVDGQENPGRDAVETHPTTLQRSAAWKLALQYLRKSQLHEDIPIALAFEHMKVEERHLVALLGEEFSLENVLRKLDEKDEPSPKRQKSWLTSCSFSFNFKK